MHEVKSTESCPLSLSYMLCDYLMDLYIKFHCGKDEVGIIYI